MRRTSAPRRRHGLPGRHPLALAALLALGAAASAPAAAANVSWLGPNASFWDLASNWGGAVPGPADTALLGAFDTEVRSGIASVQAFSGTGRLRISGGTLRAATASSIGALELTGGALSGKGTVTAATLLWTGGTMGEFDTVNFGGATTVSGLATLSGSGGKGLIYGRTLNLNGGAVWSGAGGITMNDAASIFGTPTPASVINLAAGRTFDDQGNGAAGRAITNGIINNAGTYLRSAGTGSTTIASQFNNTGAVNVAAGTLFLQNGGTQTGSFSTLAGTTLSFNGGAHTLTSTPLANAGTIDFAGGTTALNGTIAFTGDVRVTGGTLTSAPTTVLTADSLNLTGGSTRLQGNVPIGALTVAGGTLSGKGTVSVGTLAWTSGTMGEFDTVNFGGTTTASGVATLSGSGGKGLIYGRTLNLNGGAVWSGAGGITMNDAASIFGTPTPASVINLAAGQTFNDQGNGAGGRAITNGIVNNAGTYLRSAGTGSTTIAATFNNTGATNVAAGTLFLQNGGTQTGSFSTLAGTTLSFNGGAHTLTSTPLVNAGTIDFAGGTTALNGTIAFTGDVRVSGGTLTSAPTTVLTADSLAISGGTARLQGPVPIGALTISGGTLSGKGTTSVGTLAWTSGTMGEFDTVNFGGTTTVSGVATISGSGGKGLIYGRTLNLNGGAVWSGAGGIAMNDAASIFGTPTPASVINLAAGQTFNDQGNGAGGRAITNGIVNNAGTYLRSAGTGSTTIASTFNNTGAVNVAAGTLFLQNGGTQTGSFSTLAGTTLSFNGGAHTLTSTPLASAGTIDFAGGTTALNGTIAFTGDVRVTGGTLTSAPTTVLTADSLVVSGGTARLQGNVPIGGLTVSGGTLSGKGTATVGTLAWTGGTMGEFDTVNFGGTTTVSGVATISGSGGKGLIYGRTLNLNGGAVWSGAGGITMNDAASIFGTPTPASVINLAAGKTFDDQGNGAAGRAITNGIINNAGTYLRSAGTGSTTIASQFNNTGAVNVAAGTLFLQNGGTQTGSFSTLAGTTLSFNGGAHTLTSTPLANAGTIDFAGGTTALNGTIAFAGDVRVSGGTLTSAPATTLTADSLVITGGTARLQGSVPIGASTVSGGTLSGKGTVAATTLLWTSGTMGEFDTVNFGGTTTVAGAAVISGSGGKGLIYGRTLNLNGGAVWLGAGGITMNDAASIFGTPTPASVINLAAGQTFNDQGNGAAGRAITNGIINNAGTYLRSAGTGSTTIASQFNNTGAVNVAAGTLFLQNGGTQTGSFSTLAGTTLSFNGGAHTLTSTPLANAGTIDFAGGTTALNGTIAFTGDVRVTGGITTSAPTTVLTADSLVVSGGTARLQGPVPIGALTISGGTLSGKGTTSVGTLAWTSGTMGEFDTVNFGGTTTVSGVATISGSGGKGLIYGRTLNLNGGAVWSGAGGITMNDAASIFGTPTPASVINLAAGKTFDDQGNGAAGRAITNGIINNAGTYLRSAGTGSTTIASAFNNTGRVQVDAGILSFSAASSLQGPTGTLAIGPAGRAELFTGNSTVGTLQNNGSAANALDLGTRTITVFTDYDNASFGVGNAFNRRANVATSGAGNRLVAAGNTNQALGGSNISGGTTATPTLLLGAVHVGLNNIPYQILNTGTPGTGPSLRGAVQTVFAGGGITDPRLSGDGATSSNWGAVLPGGSTTRTVTFTVEQAGLLVAVTNQSVRIVNNFDNTLSQVLNISSSPGYAAYNLAAANTLPAITLPNQRVGGTLSQALAIANTAPIGSFTEGLNASFGAITGHALANGGSINLLPGQGANSSAMVLTLDTSSAGARSGSAVLNFTSDGSGTSGLGTTALPSQTVAISGNVYRLASPSAVAPAAVQLPNQRVGGTLSQTLTLANTAAADGFSERLNASFVNQVNQGSATFSGSIALLGAGSSDSSSLRVGVDTSVAGPRGGLAVITLASDGAGTSGFAALALASQSVAVSGDVYRLASPVVQGSVLLAARVGDALPVRSISISNSSPDIYTERLNATLGSLSAGFNGSGSITGLAAGGSSQAITVGLASTATAGSSSGTAALGLVSSGAGTTLAPDANLPGANVALTGRVYAPAVAQLNTPALNFGIVRVGDSVAPQGVSVSNTASAALTDGLNATPSIAGAPANGSPFVTGGGLGALAAGSTSSNGIVIGLNTSTAGVYSGTANLAFASTNPDLANLPLGTGTVALQAQVNNIAQSTLARTSGSASFGQVVFPPGPPQGPTYVLSFGTLLQGSAATGALLSLTNSASGPADALNGVFDLSGITAGSAFSLAGFGSFSGLQAGEILNGLTVSFSTGLEGVFSEVVVLSRISTNGSGPDLALQNLTLQLQGQVVAVPEPGTYVLMLGGLLLLARRLRLRRAAA